VNGGILLHNVLKSKANPWTFLVMCTSVMLYARFQWIEWPERILSDHWQFVSSFCQQSHISWSRYTSASPLEMQFDIYLFLCALEFYNSECSWRFGGYLVARLFPIMVVKIVFLKCKLLGLFVILFCCFMYMCWSWRCWYCYWVLSTVGCAYSVVELPECPLVTHVSRKVTQFWMAITRLRYSPCVG
jgi:hypothetical protein